MITKLTLLPHITTEIDTLIASLAHGINSAGYFETLQQCWRDGERIETGSREELNLRRSVETLHKLANDLGFLHGGLVREWPWAQGGGVGR